MRKGLRSRTCDTRFSARAASAASSVARSRGRVVGTVQEEEEWRSRLVSCHAETVAVRLAAGAALDPTKLPRAIEFPGGKVRTSMKKDFDAGRPLELDAIAGPIVRGGRQHGIATPATE